MTKSILSEIVSQIALLRQAKALLSSAGTTAIKRKPGRPSKTAAIVVPVAQKAKKRKKMSAEGRERVRQAQIKRWAAVRQAAKTTAVPFAFQAAAFADFFFDFDKLGCGHKTQHSNPGPGNC